ncbi:MAG: 3-oxoacyl-[acyl-carrier protein] reductase [Parcubacteria group bacterium Gr01-1014_2]|nr:MAG: 3-oxoacyl-[acyl-carrier protein] reductase [Parcubacteria group bacterium Gr01-1014_2]
MENYSVYKNLKGKTVWITGGKRIGKEVAYSLAELGANLVLSYRSSEKEAEEVAKKIKKLGRKVLVVQCDTAIRESVQRAVSQIKKSFKRLDILVLLASVFKSVNLEKIKDEDWDSNFATHVKGTFWPIQLSLPLMRPGSHIITVADRTSIGKIYPGYLPYAVTKSAVAALTRALAQELGSKGIFVNSIAPGPILKPDDISKNEWQKIRGSSFIKYPITDKEAVREFVDTVIRLCFVRSSGSIYPLDLGHL